MCDRMHGAGSAASPKAQLDWSCAYKAKAGILQNEDVWANAANMGLEAWFEMYLMPLHPELAIVGMRALSQLISASSCERNWSTHGQVHTKTASGWGHNHSESCLFKQQNGGRPSTRDADELKMFARENEDVEAPRLAKPVAAAVIARAGTELELWNTGTKSEALRRRGAESRAFGPSGEWRVRVASGESESRVASPSREWRVRVASGESESRVASPSREWRVAAPRLGATRPRVVTRPSLVRNKTRRHRRHGPGP